MKTAKEILIGLCLEHNGNWEKIYKDVLDKKSSETTTTDNVITLLDKEYPENLKQGYKPPFALFYEGNIKLLNDKNYTKVGIVGELVQEGLDLVLSKELDNVCFVLDADSPTAIDIATTYSNPVIMVCAYSIEECLTQQQIRKIIKNGGLIITERPIIYQGDISKEEMAFVLRVIAGLSDSILTLPINKRSTALQVINFALSNGNTEIMVLPTDTVKGQTLANNDLLFSGAVCVYDKNSFESIALGNS